MNRLPSALQHGWGALSRITHHAPRLPLAVSLLCLPLTACFHREPAADLVIINGNEPESLDPAIVVGISEMRITRALFEGLLRLDPEKAEPSAGLAERWEISTNGTLYTFHLRTNAAWSSGAPIT